MKLDIAHDTRIRTILIDDGPGELPAGRLDPWFLTDGHAALSRTLLVRAAIRRTSCAKKRRLLNDLYGLPPASQLVGRSGLADGEGDGEMKPKSPPDATSEDASTLQSSRIPRWGELFAALFFVACSIIVLLSPGELAQGRQITIHWPPNVLHWVLGLRWTLAVLVSAPFWLSAIVASRLLQRPTFRLRVGQPPPDLAARDWGLDQDEWRQIRGAVESTWSYEKDRIFRLRRRMRLQALMFGLIMTFVLMCCVVVLTSPAHNRELITVAYSAMAAASTAFLTNLVRIMHRSAGGDTNACTFSWATRSLVLVIVADIGLLMVLKNEITSVPGAVLLGIFAGATGDHALEIFLEKAAAVFKVTAPAAVGPSPLLKIEGMTAEHVERLAEEGIFSVHDLAFVPTARLFFATTYSLQQICNWQDRALLLVYVGHESTEALARDMQIRGAIDLRAVAHDILYSNGEAQSKNREIRDELLGTLHLSEGGLTALLESMAHDEVTMRLRLHWASAVEELSPSEAQQATDTGCRAIEQVNARVPPGPESSSRAVHSTTELGSS
jgi:hypothetical protein